MGLPWGKTGVVSGKPVFLTVHGSRDEKSFLVTGREIQDPFLHGILQLKPGAYTLKPGLQNPSNQGG